MKDYKFSVKFTLALVYAAMVILVAFSIAFPFFVQWFVEIRHKDPSLATTIMIVYYPCIPFAVAFLIALRNLLNNLKIGLIWGDANIRHLKVTSVCCLMAGIIMIIGGFKYMPFWISGFAAMAGALVSAVFERVFSCELYNRREKEFESVRDMYEKSDNIGNR